MSIILIELDEDTSKINTISTGIVQDEQASSGLDEFSLHFQEIPGVNSQRKQSAVIFQEHVMVYGTTKNKTRECLRLNVSYVRRISPSMKKIQLPLNIKR